MWLKKLNLLLWKNWILIKRHPVAAICELIFPIAVIVLFALVRDAFKIVTQPATYSNIIDIQPINCEFESIPIKQIGYTPNDEFNKKLMDEVAENFKFIKSMKFIGFKNNVELNQWIEDEIEPVAAVIFESSTLNSPNHLNYIIRMPQKTSKGETTPWNTDKLYYTDIYPGPNDEYNTARLYHETCFLMLQNEIDYAFMKAVKPGLTIEKLKNLKNFPYPSFIYDEFIDFTTVMFPVLFVICMVFSARVLIKNITVERESRLKESMRMMGLSSTQYWLSWFIRSFVILTISFTINLIFTSTIAISDKPMFGKSNPFLIWIFFISYITAMITFCFLISVIIKKPSRAGLIGSIVFFMTLLPFTIFNETFYKMNYGLKALYCMLINTSMGQGITMILMAETNENGVGFSNYFKRNVDMNFSFGELLIFMDIGSAILMLLTVYIEKTFPGDVGVAEPIYFPLRPIIRFFRKKLSNESEDPDLEEPNERSISQEEVPGHLNTGIEIINLTKRLGNKYAVKNLSLDLYEGQITVLLGHNGAGKTTAMSLMTGLFKPTSGTVIVNGYDITKNIDEARQSLGVCPQHNVLFEELTVQEHLKFFCKLKGMDNTDDIKKEIRKYSMLLGISEKLNAESRTLSGGQKRRLSIAIALCGNSKFVILDEATSGMDPSSRRDLWDLLIAEKKDRTILISTHFMDEADILGDRIAIMSEGHLQTVGSSYYLKKKFGIGYRLTCVKNDGFDAQKVLYAIRKYASDAYIESNGDTEAVFVISKDELPVFDQIFKQLEENSKQLNLSSFGCSYASLEDVFLKLAHRNRHNVKDTSAFEVTRMENFSKTDGNFLILYQIYATILKKFHVLRRSWKMLLIFLIISVLGVFAYPNFRISSLWESTELKISFDTYEETETYMNFGRESSLADYYSRLFLGKDKIIDTAEDIEKIIFRKYNESIGLVNSKNLIAVSFESEKLIGWFNTQPYHTMPLTINTINRAILKSIMGNDYEISLTNKPYEFKEKDARNQKVKKLLKTLTNNFLVVVFIMLSWPMIYIENCIKEREMRFKFLQFICGMKRLVFWITSFIFDYALFILMFLVILSCFVSYNHNPEYFSEDFGSLMAIAACYGFSWIPFIYAVSFLYNKPSTGTSHLDILSLTLIILAAVDKVLRSKEYENKFIEFLTDCFHWIGMIFAPFTLVHTTLWYSIQIFLTELDSATTSDHQKFNNLTNDVKKLFNLSEITESIVMNIVSGCIFLIIVLLKDFNIFDSIYYKINESKINQRSSSILFLDDDDVVHEIQKVNAMSSEDINSSNLVLKNLTKTFKNSKAVKNLSLNVNKHECFGLLGMNGAGKTTTFKMMTGDELITSGDIWIKGKDLKTQMLEAHKFIGYCPQFDNCLPQLTGRETLKIFALIRGIKMNEINELIDEMAKNLDFKMHLNKQVRAYSGGNRRKLSTALSLLGNPDLIFLDECTTGVDPQARRQIWTAIKAIRDNPRLSSSIILTSHSMDECEALCTRIGIMVAGQFQCLGPIQHLKNKYSRGFVLTIKTGFNDERFNEHVKQKIFERFLRTAELQESYLDILIFHLKDANLKYSIVFKVMARIKEETGINDYSLTQMSLEDVFLNISHH